MHFFAEELWPVLSYSRVFLVISLIFSCLTKKTEASSTYPEESLQLPNNMITFPPSQTNQPLFLFYTPKEIISNYVVYL